jgi:hypothetical protein
MPQDWPNGRRTGDIISWEVSDFEVIQLESFQCEVWGVAKSLAGRLRKAAANYLYNTCTMGLLGFKTLTLTIIDHWRPLAPAGPTIKTFLS